ncbi:wax ester/triacylglycerol synthase family O-acyltransferase [Actinomycetospora chlora]|uniref:diacylglycerol O-acyltransferase n=1 Tax=Actinomycetospora chlora TaxID=663608 RepID=A0ABP9B527_9PSEU
MADALPVTAEDGLWLRIDRPTNVLAIVSVIWTATPVDPDALRRLLLERVVDPYPVFRRRPVLDEGSGSATWEEDPDFDVDHHLLVGPLPPGRPETVLRQEVGRLRSTPVDLTRPPWSVHLLQGYADGSAMVVRAHHALADGVRMTRLLLALLDPCDGRADDARPVATHGADDVLPDLLATVRHPWRVLGAGLRLATSALNTAVDTVEILGWVNPRTAWSGPPGETKTAAWSEAIPLELLAHLAHEDGASVNDVCLALLGGAVARAHEDELSGPTPSDLAWMVPVNLDPIDAGPPERLGNHFALVLVVLPLRGPFRARLAEVHARVERIRHSWEPLLTHGLQRILGRAPGPLGTAVSDALAGKAIGVITNVPGPRTPMALAGAEVTGLVGWAPCSADQLLTACIVSYAGTVRIGFGTDQRRMGDARLLVHALDQELAAVVREHRAAHPGHLPRPTPRRRTP